MRIYKGKPGCMCGCKGKYVEENERSFGTHLKRMYKMIAEGVDEYEKTEQYEYAERNQTVYCLYF